MLAAWHGKKWLMMLTGAGMAELPSLAIDRHHGIGFERFDRGFVQSAVIPASLITLAHLASSALM